jgi:hypothetical protein
VHHADLDRAELQALEHLGGVAELAGGEELDLEAAADSAST